MNNDLLERNFLDTLGTKAKNFGSRLGNAVVAGTGQTFGARATKSNSRLSINIIASELTHNWEKWLTAMRAGGHNVEGDMDDLEKYIEKYFGDEALNWIKSTGNPINQRNQTNTAGNQPNLAGGSTIPPTRRSAPIVPSTNQLNTMGNQPNPNAGAPVVPSTQQINTMANQPNPAGGPPSSVPPQNAYGQAYTANKNAQATANAPKSSGFGQANVQPSGIGGGLGSQPPQFGKKGNLWGKGPRMPLASLPPSMAPSSATQPNPTPSAQAPGSSFPLGNTGTVSGKIPGQPWTNTINPDEQSGQQHVNDRAQHTNDLATINHALSIAKPEQRAAIIRTIRNKIAADPNLLNKYPELSKIYHMETRMVKGNLVKLTEAELKASEVDAVMKKLAAWHFAEEHLKQRKNNNNANTTQQSQQQSRQSQGNFSNPQGEKSIITLTNFEKAATNHRIDFSDERSIRNFLKNQNPQQATIEEIKKFVHWNDPSSPGILYRAIRP